jgi:hypothetical protein
LRASRNPVPAFGRHGIIARFVVRLEHTESDHFFNILDEGAGDFGRLKYHVHFG